MTAAVPDALRMEIVAALREAGARFALLPGSRVAGEHTSSSDTDVAAWWDGHAPAPFEVLLPPGVDLLVLNDAPLELTGRVAQGASAVRRRSAGAGPLGSDHPEESMPTNCPGSGAATASSSTASAVVDEVRVLRLLRSVTDDLAVLHREASADERRRADPLWLRGVKYTFVTAIEASVRDDVVTDRLADPSDLAEFVAAVTERTVGTGSA